MNFMRQILMQKYRNGGKLQPSQFSPLGMSQSPSATEYIQANSLGVDPLVPLGDSEIVPIST